MTAARTGSVEAVRLLVSHGADLDAREHTRGQTALMWAVAQQHPEVVKALVALGADVQARAAPQPRRIHTRTAGFNPSGVIDTVLGSNTPILFAARQGNLDVARHLVAAGADVNDPAATGTSALVVAAHSGHTALALSRRDGFPAARRPDLLVPNTRHAATPVYRVASTKLTTLYRSLSLAKHY